MGQHLALREGCERLTCREKDVLIFVRDDLKQRLINFSTAVFQK